MEDSYHVAPHVGEEARVQVAFLLHWNNVPWVAGAHPDDQGDLTLRLGNVDDDWSC